MISSAIIASSNITEPAVITPNTFIDGEGVNTTTAGELETVLGLSAGQVSYFNLVGNDIEAVIDGSFDIPSNCFEGNLDITRFETSASLSGFGNYSFKDCENLQEFICDNYEGDLRAGTFQNCYSLTTFQVSKFYAAPTYAFRNCSVLTNIDFSELTETGIGTFQSCNALTEVVAPNLTSVSVNSFASCANITKFHANNLTEAGPSLLFGCTSLTDVSLPLLETAGVNLFRDCYSLVSVSLPEITSIGDGCFRNCFAIESINMPKLSSCGSSPSLENVFTGVKAGGSITVDSVLATNNGGSPDGDLTYLSGTKGWSITYI